MVNNVRISFIPVPEKQALMRTQSCATIPNAFQYRYDRSNLHKAAHSRSFPQLLDNSTSLHFLLNSILIAEATMALLRFSLLLTILLSVGQTTRQTDEEEPTNVSCSIVFPTSVDLDPLAKSSVSDEVVPDR